MAAAEAADQKLPREREARVKAAAWAWYQRSGGSIAAGAGRSEAFATRCSARLSPSRFQREAAMRVRMRKLASQASDLTSSSSMDKFSGSSSSFSHYTFGDVAERDETTCIDTILNSDQEDKPLTYEQPSLDLVSMDTAACWDCGSSLFDSFELVAMSKKLDAELHEPIIEGHHEVESVVGLEIDHNDHNQQNVLSLCDTPFNAISPPNSPPPASHQEASDTYDIFDKLISAPDKQSKQAVYDMFCHYGDAAKHVTKQSCKRPSPADATCGGESRKHKLRSGRMSFHGLAKALHSITHLHLHTSAAGGGDTCHAEQDHHHHHHRHYSPLPQASMASKAISTQGQGAHIGGTNPSGEHYAYDDVIEAGSQSKSRHIHHHHHHHYHYLFHSDEDFRLQPLDKSLMVAAAGLRSSKASPALSSYLESPARGDFPVDFGRKWGELGSISSPNFQY